MLDHLEAGFDVKSAAASGVFEGYASIFNSVDDARDSVRPGAFAQSIAARRPGGVKLLWQHDPASPVGTIEQLHEDGRGLFVRGRLLLSVTRAREALALMRCGAVDGLSIGYRTVKSHTDRNTGTRILSRVDLWEVSLVTFPLQRRARITAFKGRRANTARRFEPILPEAGAATRATAGMIAARGFSGPCHRRDADGAGWRPVLDSLARAKTHLV